MERYLVIEDSGLGTALCNSAVVVEAETPVEAAVRATKCPIPMFLGEEWVPGLVWSVQDEISKVGWNTTEMKVKFPDLIGGNSSPRNQWLVLVVSLGRVEGVVETPSLVAEVIRAMVSNSAGAWADSPLEVQGAEVRFVPESRCIVLSKKGRTGIVELQPRLIAGVLPEGGVS